ncbi:MAG: arsenic transporter, partial [Candidatus Omnitrophica bacterium]|nr:arsenic transporter [Candidatus Omnitrophota bacterium]
MSNREITLFIFITSYLLFVMLPKKRTWVALISALAIIFLRIITFKDVFLLVNWNVMGIFIGTLL